MEIIREDFFHFMWENLHFSKNRLKTASGEQISIIHPGNQNNGDGPDYRFARIRIGEIVFCGDVELHKKTSDWDRHGHQNDSRYERVILHVVVQDDLNRCDVTASDGHKIPTLELHSALPTSLSRLWRAYHSPSDLPCSGIINEIPPSEFDHITDEWNQAYFNHRLNRMVALYASWLPVKQAWRGMLIRGVFQGLGYHNNQYAMLKLADLLISEFQLPNPSKAAPKQSSLIRHEPVNKMQPPEYDENSVTFLQNRLMQLSGLSQMNGSRNSSSCNNRKNPVNNFTRISPVKISSIIGTNITENPVSRVESAILNRTEWDFSSSRPANQPVTRVSQAAELFHRLHRISVKKWMENPVDTIWDKICNLDYAPPLGKNRKDVIFHNVVLPSSYLLGRWLHKKDLCNSIRAQWALQQIELPPRVRQIFHQSKFPTGNYQFKLATLHQFKYFCTARRCAECNVMKYIARP